MPQPRLREAHPGCFSDYPEIFDRLYTDWATLVKFQRTRDVLRLMAAVILKCYDKRDLDSPTAIGRYLSPLVEKKELLKSSAGYRLAHQVREELDAALGKAPSTVVVNKQITALGAQLPDMAERAYFQEMLICHDHTPAWRLWS